MGGVFIISVHRDFIAVSPKVVVVIDEDQLAVSINPIHIVSIDELAPSRCQSPTRPEGTFGGSLFSRAMPATPAGGVHFLNAAKPRPRRKLRLSRSSGGDCSEIKVRRTSSASASGWQAMTQCDIVSKVFSPTELRRWEGSDFDAEPFTRQTRLTEIVLLGSKRHPDMVVHASGAHCLVRKEQFPKGSKIWRSIVKLNCNRPRCPHNHSHQPPLLPFGNTLITLPGCSSSRLIESP